MADQNARLLRDRYINPAALAIGLFCGFWSAFASDRATGETLALVEVGEAACTQITLTDGKSDLLLKRAAEVISDATKRWSGVELPLSTLNDGDWKFPAKPAIVLATLGTLRKVAPELVESHTELAKAGALDEQGFVCAPITVDNNKLLFVVSQTPRGVYNGAVYLRDFCIDGDRQNHSLEFQPVVRSPKMGGRAAYTLTIWAQEAEYSAADWKKEFESFARDGFDRIYFWVSGHFPSKQFPQTYKRKNIFNGKLYDTTEKSAIGSIDDLKEIVAGAHELGLKIYLGGGLGAWCGTQFITNEEPETLKTGPAEPSLCPSNPKSHKALVDYYQEVFAAIPEADGLFIESADEVGECRCPECSRAIDKTGSRHFGQAQLDICQEIMDGIWRDHPHARLAYTIGYQEHAKDVAYYDRIQQMSKDPRFEWMEARSSWQFAGANGELRPAAAVSKQVMRWQLYAGKRYDEMIADANRVGTDGMYGLIFDFSPGYSSGSFYNEIPFPTDILPHALTGLVYREVTWNPALTPEQLRDLTQKRFFGKEAPRHLADDVWNLREIIRSRRGAAQLPEIEQHIESAKAGAGPKTAEGLALMTRAVSDIRTYLPKKKPKS